MATLKELMGDKVRGDGRRFFSASMSIANEKFFEPIFKDNYGDWYGLDDRANKDYFHETDTDDWEPYTEPKPKKKLKMYRYILKNKHADFYTVTNYQSGNFECYGRDYKIVGTEEIEIEVDE